MVVYLISSLLQAKLLLVDDALEKDRICKSSVLLAASVVGRHFILVQILVRNLVGRASGGYVELHLERIDVASISDHL